MTNYLSYKKVVISLESVTYEDSNTSLLGEMYYSEKPENELAKSAGLTLGDRGGIIVNEYLQTSNEDIYAVGDAVFLC